MNQKLIKKLKKLTSIPSVSGNEGECASWLKKELKPFAGKIFVDKIGNLIATKGSPKIVIFAHMDKVGYMVSEIGRDGIWVLPLAEKKALPGEARWPVEILAKEKIKGVLVEKDKRKHKLLVILDKGKIGKVSIGDFVALAPNFIHEDSFVYSQGLDNKLGILAACEVFKAAKDLAFVGTVMEETSKVGAKAAAWKLKPKAALVLDVTYDQNPIEECPIKIGQGPAICLKDSLLPDKNLVKRLIQTAKKYNTSYQLEVLESGGSDALGFHNLFEGIPFVFVGIPIKFMHTPGEVGNIGDLESTIELLRKFLS